MATVELRDGFGLIVDISPDPASIFVKYLKNPSAITAQLHNSGAIEGVRVGQDPFASQTLGISFDQPIELGATAVELTVKPELSGTVTIAKESLFDGDDDPFRASIPIPDKQHAFVSAGIKAGLDIGPARKSGDLRLGFNAGTETVITNYRLFSLNDEVAPAIAALVREFVVPGDLQDIESMAPGSVVTAEGSGSISFSATANLLCTVNPLAAVNTSIGDGILNLKDSGSLSVKAGYKLTGEYQLRIQRLTGRKFQLSYGKKRGSDFSVAAETEIGVSASTGGFELIEGLLKMVSADPVPDKNAFHNAGLTDKQIATIALAIKAGIERSVELSLKGELDFLDTICTAFSYEVDLDRLNAEGRQAITAALSGHLSGIEGSTLSGVTPLKSIFSTLREGKRILKVNLLGIFNYGSVSSLFQKGTVIVDQQSGEITITDEIGAERIQFTSNNFAKDSAKLRKVLAESFLVTVTYRASKTVLQAPRISTSYSFFELHQNANFSNIQDYLQVAQALKLISPEQFKERAPQLRSIGSFGPATLYLESHYNDEIFRDLFLDPQGNARQKPEYQGLGRQAMASVIVPDGSVDSARLRPLTDDAVWASMQEGTTTFATVLGRQGFAQEYIPVIASDYSAIIWWADAMHDVGVELASVLSFIKQQGAVNVRNSTLVRLRRELDTKLSQVAANTHDHFAKPWGFIVMDLASGRKAPIRLQINCPKLTLIAPASASRTSVA